VRELEQALAQKDSRVAELELTIEHLKSKLANLQETSVTVASAQNESRVAELEQANAQKDAQIQKLEEVVAITEKSVITLEEEKAAAMEKLKLEEAESEEVVKKLEQVIVDQYNRIKELEGKVAHSQSREQENGQVENPPINISELNKQVSNQITPRSTAPLSQAIGVANPQSVSPNLISLIEFFDLAAEKVETPTVSVSLDGKSIVIMRNSTKYPGALNIKAGGIWQGRINRDGSLYKSRECESWVMPILVEFAANPEAMAQQHGKITGSCCFCARTLKDSKSIQTGYGEICARHYGLPWPVLQANLVESVPTAI
jgi:uncharacterized coiled-coil protein SlyX